MARLDTIPKYRFQHRIKTQPENVWHAFLNEHNLEDWLDADSRAGMRARQDYKFEWRVNGRQITGYIEDLEPYEEIVFRWRIDDDALKDRWPDGHYVRTSLHLSDVGEETYLDIQIEDIPFGERNTVRNFWHDTVVSKLEEYLEDDPELEEAAA